MALGLRRRHAFDIPFWHGKESTVCRDRLLMGTALSAPVAMLAAQTDAIAALLRRPDSCWAGWAPRRSPDTWQSGWYGGA
jgi:hypothetical protein